MAKRVFDIVFSIVAILLTSPFMIVAVIVILVSSPGPVLYRARRVGKDGEIFVMHKFRTLHRNQGEAGAPVTARRDSRIFPAGRVLRRLKLDELPQFFDVLRGTMAVVGPRPEDPAIVERYYSARHRMTLRVKPGITSPGAIWGYLNEDLVSNDGDAELQYVTKVLDAKLRVEQAYIDSRPGIGDDLRVVVQTIATVARMALARLGSIRPAGGNVDG